MTTDNVSPIARQLDDERQAARYLNLSPRTLQAWRRKGDGPRYLKLGAAVRYDRADLDAWLEERTRANTAA
jgi:excisionase family DNA binding protein